MLQKNCRLKSLKRERKNPKTDRLKCEIILFFKFSGGILGCVFQSNFLKARIKPNNPSLYIFKIIPPSLEQGRKWVLNWHHFIKFLLVQNYKISGLATGWSQSELTHLWDGKGVYDHQAVGDWIQGFVPVPRWRGQNLLKKSLPNPIRISRNDLKAPEVDKS